MNSPGQVTTGKLQAIAAQARSAIASSVV